MIPNTRVSTRRRIKDSPRAIMNGMKKYWQEDQTTCTRGKRDMPTATHADMSVALKL